MKKLNLTAIVYYMAEKLEPADKQIREIFLKNFYPTPKAFMRYLETQTTPEEFWNNFSSNPDFIRDATLKELEWIACNALPLLPMELEDLVESVDCNCYKEVK